MIDRDTYFKPLKNVLKEYDIDIDEFKLMIKELEDKREKKYITTEFNQLLCTYLRYTEDQEDKKENIEKVLESYTKKIVTGEKLQDIFEEIKYDDMKRKLNNRWFDREVKIGLDYLAKLKQMYPKCEDLKFEFITEKAGEDDRVTLGRYRDGIIYLNDIDREIGCPIETHREFLQERKRKLRLREQRKKLNKGLENYIKLNLQSIKTVIAHEFGHALDDRLELYNNVELNKLYNLYIVDKKLIEYELTKYASYKEEFGEFLAEAFAESIFKDARPLSIRVRNIIDKVAKEYD